MKFNIPIKVYQPLVIYACHSRFYANNACMKPTLYITLQAKFEYMIQQLTLWLNQSLSYKALEYEKLYAYTTNAICKW